MERWREGFHQKGKIYQQDIFSWYIPGRLKLLDVIKSDSTCNSLVFGCYSPSFCAVSSSQNIKEESYDLCGLALRSLFDTMLICVSLTNCNRL